MKKTLLALAFMFAGTATANPIYLSGSSEPWGSPSNPTNMNTAFGSGNWSRATFGDTGLFSNNANFIFIDGGNGQGSNLFNWLVSERTNLENFILNGGSVFLNAASWGESMNIFSSSILYGNFGGGNSGTCYLSDNTFGTAGSYFTGNGCTHGSLSLGETGWNQLMHNGGAAILAERSFGQGWLTLGNLTTDNFWGAGTTGLNTNSFRADVLNRAQSRTHGTAPVSAPAPLTLLALSLVAFGLVRRKQAN